MEINFKKILKQKKIFLLILFSIVFNFSTIDLNAHPSKKHKPMVCILEEDRTKQQKSHCKTLLFFHRLCKLDQDCAILELEKRKQELENKEQEIQAKEAADLRKMEGFVPLLEEKVGCILGLHHPPVTILKLL